MKISKSNKILILISAVFLCLIMAVSFNFAKKEVMADEEPSIELTSTTFKVDGTSITLVDGIRYKKGFNDLYVMIGDTKYTFSSEENKLSFVVDDTEGNVNLVENSNEFVFNIIDKTKKEGSAKIKVNDSTTEFDIKITSDTKAPKYNSTDFNDNKATYIEDLEKNLKVKVTVEGEEKEYYKPLGSSKYVTLPSMDKFVSDDTTPFNEMTYKVYYKNSKYDTSYSSGTTKAGTDFKIPVEVPGEYTFFVAFIDAFGNEMDKEYCKGYSFTFTILEDYPVEVNISNNDIAKGYIGVKYTLGTSIFDVTDNCQKTYKLFFKGQNENEYTDVTLNKDYDFSNSDLSFMPKEKGSYKITCEASSLSTGLKNSNSVTIEVSEEPTVINKPDSEFVAWIKGHVVSVVFLCLGVVCLIGIIVLLCIKPKEETDEESTPKEASKTKNKNK